MGTKYHGTTNIHLNLTGLQANTKWQDLMALKMTQFMDYNMFHDKGYDNQCLVGCKCIKVHWMIAIKHDRQHKSRLITGGHLTDTPLENIYSGVIAL